MKQKSLILFAIIFTSILLVSCNSGADGKTAIGLIRKNIANFTVILTLSDSEYDNTKYVMKYYRTENDLVNALAKGKVQLAVLPFTKVNDDRLAGKSLLAMPVMRGGNFLVSKQDPADSTAFLKARIGFINKGLQKELCELIGEENDFIAFQEFESVRKMKKKYSTGDVEMMILNIPDAFKYTDNSVVSNYFLEKYPLYTSYDLLINKNSINDDTKELIHRMKESNGIVNSYPEMSYINFNKAFGIHHKYSQEALRSVSYMIEYTKNIREFQKRILLKEMTEQEINTIYIGEKDLLMAE